jgi:hypothetical protein
MINLDKYPGIKSSLDYLSMMDLPEFIDFCGYAKDPTIQNLVQTQPTAFLQFLRDNMEGKTIREYDGISIKYTYHSMLMAPIAEGRLTEIFGKLQRATTLAKSMTVAAREYYERQKLKASDLFENILKRHFRFSEENRRKTDLETMAYIMRLTELGLHSRVRISNNKPGKAGTAAGYVSLKKDSKSTETRNPYHNVLPDELLTTEEKLEGQRVRGSIHIDYANVYHGNMTSFTKEYKELDLARIIIHEATHKFGGTEDHAYCHQTEKYANMTQEQAFDNADSYAFAILCMAKGRMYDNTDPELRD